MDIIYYFLTFEGPITLNKSQKITAIKKSNFCAKEHIRNYLTNEVRNGKINFKLEKCSEALVGEVYYKKSVEKISKKFEKYKMVLIVE